MKKILIFLFLATLGIAAVNDVKVTQQVLLSPPSFKDALVPFESAVSTTLASYRSGFGLGTEDGPTFASLTVTGVGTFSGTGAFLTRSGATTSNVRIDMINTGQTASFGVESSAGGAIVTGATGYATVINSGANVPVQIGVNSTLVGSFSSTGLAVTGTLSASTRLDMDFDGVNFAGGQFQDTTDTSGAAFLAFLKANGTVIGSISRVTTTDAVAYNTISDGRLKTNVRDFTAEDSGRIIDGLRPRWFDWVASDLTETVEETVATGIDDEGKIVAEKRQKQQKVTDPARIAKHITDNQSIIGFVAQEIAQVDPALVRIGAVTPGDSDPETITRQWARSDAALVPILVREIQSLRARVEALEKK